MKTDGDDDNAATGTYSQPTGAHTTMVKRKNVVLEVTTEITIVLTITVLFLIVVLALILLALRLYDPAEYDFELFANRLLLQMMVLRTNTFHQFIHRLIEYQRSYNIPIVESSLRNLIAHHNGCQDEFDKCSLYNERFACASNPGWMIFNCANYCNMCDYTSPSTRCAGLYNITKDIVPNPGDLNQMFERIPSIIQTSYPHIHYNISSTDPYVIVFDNFLTDLEAARILYAVEGKFQRSTGVTDDRDDLGRIVSTVTEVRTSSNAWCQSNCDEDLVIRNVTNRIAHITNAHIRNFEYMQVLEYGKGQFYAAHNDFISNSYPLNAMGPRILTFFLYLSDVSEGGETSFPQLDIHVQPRRGRAVLWPSVLNSDPYEIDTRTVRTQTLHQNVLLSN